MNVVVDLLGGLLSPGFLYFCPSCFCGPGRDLPATVIAECHQAALAADPTTSAAHLGHHLRQQGRVRDHRKACFTRFNHLVEYASRVLDRIELRLATALWHTLRVARQPRTCQEGGISN